jgi:hypothetical protein
VATGSHARSANEYGSLKVKLFCLRVQNVDRETLIRAPCQLFLIQAISAGGASGNVFPVLISEIRPPLTRKSAAISLCRSPRLIRAFTIAAPFAVKELPLGFARCERPSNVLSIFSPFGASRFDFAHPEPLLRFWVF